VRILSFDIGSSSLGWSLIDPHNRCIVNLGVRIFPEGVDRDKKGGELSKNERRRLKRATRRQAQRRARRKRRLRDALVEAGLYPADTVAQAEYDGMDPYDLRRRALDEPLELYELGRVFLHLGQRRGFLSNRKGDRGKKQENSKLLAEISELAQRMDRAGDRTLGEHLAKRMPTPGEAAATPMLPENEDAADDRVRRLHTHRTMYLEEFDRIWEAQRRHHPSLLTDRLKYGESEKPQRFPVEPDPPRKGKKDQSPLRRYGLHGLIFFQRPLYWSEKSIGFCELEGEQRRCSRADRLAQKARLYQEVNNLRIIDTDDRERDLEPEERRKLLVYLSSRKEATFDQIKKHLGLFETARFNIERLAKGSNQIGGRSKLKGLETDYILSQDDCFGDRWHELAEDEKDAIVRDLLDPKLDDARTFDKAVSQWGLSAAQAEAVLNAVDGLPTGYAKLSRKALLHGKTGDCGILAALEAGLPMQCGEGRDDHGKPTDAIHAAGYLRADERDVKLLKELPEPEDIPNPLVRRALYEVRHIVNAIIRKHGAPDEVRLELAREVKGSLDKRQQTRIKQIEQQRRRDEAAKRIRDVGYRPDRKSINRYLLWEEQEGLGIYSGKPLSIEMLFGGVVEIDHILPRPRSLDDSMANKALDLREVNARKGNRTPWEWLERDGDPQVDYDAVLQRARKLGHYGKYRKFTQKTLELDDFIARQLVDTAYISRAVVQYLRQLGRPSGEKNQDGTEKLAPVHVVGRKGMTTATLRHLWGLNSVLHDTGFNAKKNRDDHRHHAVDAIVIALTDEARLKALSEAYEEYEKINPDTGEMELRAGYGRIQSSKLEVWPTFRRDVEDAINQIKVSHKTQRGVQGQLHEETLYGKGDNPQEYVARKPLEALSLNEVPRIRDAAVRAKIEARLREFNLDPGRGKGGIPAKAWKEPIWMNEEKRIQIKRVRVLKKEESVVLIRGGADNYHGGEGAVAANQRHRAGSGGFVKPGRQHHVAIFCTLDRKRQPKYHGVFVSMLEAAKRKRAREAIIQRHDPDKSAARFVCSLCSGDSLIIYDPVEELERIVVVTTLVSTQQRIHYKDANDARPTSERGADAGTTANALFGKLRAQKVAVDQLGRVRYEDQQKPAELAVDPDIAALARQRIAAKVSERAIKCRLADMGKKHLGAQFTAELHRLRLNESKSSD